MQLTGTKRLRDGRQMLPAGGYSEPTENQGIMNMETGEIIALSKKDQRIADAKKNRKELMAKLQAKVDKENAEAAKPKTGSILRNLTQLEGSEKQVKWANDIRAKVVDQIQRQIEVLDSQLNGRPASEKVRELSPISDPKRRAYLQRRHDLSMKYLEENVLNQKSAKWWIDNRSQNHATKASTYGAEQAQSEMKG